MRSARLIFALITSLLLTLILPLSGKLSADEEMLLESYNATASFGIDAVLVLDVSGSMKNSDPDCLCREAALEYVSRIAGYGHSRAAVITFSDQIQTRTQLTDLSTENGLDQVTRALNSMTYTSGDTDIGLAMSAALALLPAETDPRRSSAILLLTDGEIDLPMAADEAAAEEDSLKLALVSVEGAKESGCVIDSVMLDPSGTLDQHLCGYMAEQTGGSCTRAGEAAVLPDLFLSLSEEALLRAGQRESEEGEPPAGEVPEETETEMPASAALSGLSDPEQETEPETQTEAAPPSVFARNQNIDPVVLKGWLPGLCRGRLHLSDLFDTDSENGAASDGSSGGSWNTSESAPSLRYTAYSSDPGLLSCELDGDLLTVSGIQNGECEVVISAELIMDQTDNGPDDLHASEPSGQTASAQIRFPVRVQALIPSPLLLLIIPAALSAVLILLLIIRHLAGSRYLSGTLQWYVRADGEKIYGMPSRAMAELSDYGKKVSLDHLVQDELLEDSRHHQGCFRDDTQGKTPDHQ